MDVTNALKATPTATTNSTSDSAFNPKGVLKKDDFLHLLITELKYQDPTEPMDTQKILTQTSQLSTLEAQTNTNETMQQISKAFQSSSQFNAIGAIGKMADIGNSDIRLDKSKSVNFDLFFPKNATSGTMQITDSSGNVVKTVPLSKLNKGVHTFTWDGSDDKGQKADAGVYQVKASFVASDGSTVNTRVGTYPIESVRFDGGKAELKMGTHYIPLEQIKEIYQGA